MRPQAVKTALTKRLMAILLAVVALAAVTGSLGRLAPAAAEGTASVSILHAVPGVTVDVYANGAKVVGNFKPGTLTSPQKLPAGKYDLKIVKAGAGPAALRWLRRRRRCRRAPTSRSWPI